MSRALDRLARLLNFVSAVLVAMILCAVCTQIIMRYVFNNATTWSDPVASSALAWLTFLGATAAIHSDDNLAVRFSWKWFSPLGRRIAETICQLLTLTFAVFLSISAWQLMDITDTAEVEGLPFRMTWAEMYSITIVCGFLMIVFCIGRFVQTWRRARE